MAKKKKKGKGPGGIPPSRRPGHPPKKASWVPEDCHFCGEVRPDLDAEEILAWDYFMIPPRKVGMDDGLMVIACPGCQARWGLEEEAKLARAAGIGVEQLRELCGAAAGQVATFAQLATRKLLTLRTGRG